MIVSQVSIGECTLANNFARRAGICGESGLEKRATIPDVFACRGGQPESREPASQSLNRGFTSAAGCRHALDCLCYSHYSLASWLGVSHCRKSDSHSFGSGHYCSCHESRWRASAHLAPVWCKSPHFTASGFCLLIQCGCKNCAVTTGVKMGRSSVCDTEITEALGHPM